MGKRPGSFRLCGRNEANWRGSSAPWQWRGWQNFELVTLTFRWLPFLSLAWRRPQRTLFCPYAVFFHFSRLSLSLQYVTTPRRRLWRNSSFLGCELFSAPIWPNFTEDVRPEIWNNKWRRGAFLPKVSPWADRRISGEVQLSSYFMPSFHDIHLKGVSTSDRDCTLINIILRLV